MTYRKGHTQRNRQANGRPTNEEKVSKQARPRTNAKETTL